MRMRARVRLVAILLAVAVGAWPRTAGAQTAQDFFDDAALQDVRLTMSARDWDALKARVYEDTYYPADLRWRGVTVRNVGIRSRGFGSRLAAKPGLRVDINRYLSGQDFLGLKAFVLDNAATDASLVRESLAMKLFARMNVPAPREAHARLFVNDEYAGAYVIVESLDRTFVSRTFGAEEGDVERGGMLFEYRWSRPYGFEYLGPSLEPYAELFSPETHETDAMVRLFGPFEDMVRTFNESRDDRFADDAGRVLDLPAFITFLAVQSFVAETDGFVGDWGMNNFYVYRFRRSAPAVLIPWDADHAFSAPDLDVDHNMPTNVLTRRIMAAPELRQIYLDALLRVADVAAQPDAGDPRGWLERELARQATQIAPAVAADPVLPFSYEQFAADVESLGRFARGRPLYVACVLQGGGGDDLPGLCAGRAADAAKYSALPRANRAR